MSFEIQVTYKYTFTLNKDKHIQRFSKLVGSAAKNDSTHMLHKWCSAHWLYPAVPRENFQMANKVAKKENSIELNYRIQCQNFNIVLSNTTFHSSILAWSKKKHIEKL